MGERGEPWALLRGGKGDEKAYQLGLEQKAVAEKRARCPLLEINRNGKGGSQGDESPVRLDKDDEEHLFIEGGKVHSNRASVLAELAGECGEKLLDSGELDNEMNQRGRQGSVYRD